MKKLTKRQLIITLVTINNLILIRYLKRRKEMTKRTEIEIPKFMKGTSEVDPNNKANVVDNKITVEPKICEDKRFTNDKVNLTDADKRKIADFVKAMRLDEIEEVLNNIPVELMFRHIENEFNKSLEFKNSIKNAMNTIK